MNMALLCILLSTREGSIILFYFILLANVTEIATTLKDLYSTAPKRGSVFIGLMTPDGAIWSRYQRTVLMR